MSQRERYREIEGKGRVIRRSERKRNGARKVAQARKVAREIRALRSQVEREICAWALTGGGAYV